MPTDNPPHFGLDKDVDGVGGNGSNGKGLRKDPPLAKIGIWLLIASLATMFAAVASMYAYRLGDKPNYFFPWPPSLWISTGAIVLSSLTMCVAQRAARQGLMRKVLGYLAITLALGWVFVLSQFIAWLLLRHAGFYAQTNPFAGMFYLLTALHGFHLIVGIAWLIYIYSLAKHGALTGKRHLALELGAIYWHFMMVVWLVFFFLIVI